MSGAQASALLSQEAPNAATSTLTSAAGFFHVVNRSVRTIAAVPKPQEIIAVFWVLNEGLDRYPARLILLLRPARRTGIWSWGPWVPERLSRLIQWVSATHAQRWHQRRNSVGEGPVYQGRFKSFPVDASAHLLRVCRYVERNALTAGLVRKAQDWPWCSLSRRLALRHEVPLVTTPFLTSDAWTTTSTPRSPAILTNGALSPLRPKLWKRALTPYVTWPRSQGFAGGAQGSSTPFAWDAAQTMIKPDTHVERAEHLGVGDAAGPLKPVKQRRNRPALAVDPEPSTIRQRARKVLR